MLSEPSIIIKRMTRAGNDLTSLSESCYGQRQGNIFLEFAAVVREGRDEIERLQIGWTKESNARYAAVADERERCVKLLEAMPEDLTWWDVWGVVEKIKNGGIPDAE